MAFGVLCITLSGEEGSVKSKSEGRQPTSSPIFPGLFLNIGSVLLPIVPALRHHLSLRYCCRSLRNCYFLIMESGIGAMHRYDVFSHVRISYVSNCGEFQLIVVADGTNLDVDVAVSDNAGLAWRLGERRADSSFLPSQSTTLNVIDLSLGLWVGQSSLTSSVFRCSIALYVIADIVFRHYSFVSPILHSHTCWSISVARLLKSHSANALFLDRQCLLFRRSSLSAF
jgi:hypothetical protein